MASHPRPLSPHLQVYRWGVQMVTSILHRATGIILSVGALLIAAALVAVASGPDAWASVGAAAGSPLGLLFLLGWVWAFLFHLLNGIRHLAQDMGLGYTIEAFVRNSWLSIIGSLVLAVAICGYVAIAGELL